MTAVEGQEARSARISCSPSPSGMRTSVTTSGKRCVKLAHGFRHPGGDFDLPAFALEVGPQRHAHARLIIHN